MIYLDNAATTKPSAQVKELCLRMIEEDFYNPSALYVSAAKIKKQIEEARKTIADVLSRKSNEIVFTSGATEANNWAITRGLKNKNGNLIITEGEHPSVYETAMALKSAGIEVRTAPLQKDGTVDKEKLLRLTDDKTTLVSLIHVSNETGAVNPICELAAAVKAKSPRALVHSDGVQAFCKIPVNLSKNLIDLYSISAHKVGGLKGVGALFIRDGVHLAPLLLGGGQEGKLRSGTENTMGIVTFAAAVKSFKQDGQVANFYEHVAKTFSQMDGVTVNGSAQTASGYIVSLGIKGVKSEILQHLVYDDGVMIGLGSACSSKSKNNRILESMGVEKEFVEGNIRLSFSPDNTADEILLATKIIKKNIEKLRGMIHG